MTELFVRGQSRKRDPVKIKLAVFGGLAGLLVLTGLFAPWLAPFDPYEQELGNALTPPCAEHLLGTDRYGRDMLSRVIMGARSSIFSAVLLVLMITVLGSIVGILCGYYGGKLDTVLMRTSDVFLAFPGMVFAIAAAGVFQGGILSAVAALALITWPKYARIARSQVLTVKGMTFMEAARLSGSGTLKIICRHIVPNIAGPVIVTAVLDIGTMMMEIAGLSFLGLGAAPPTAEWGSMMSDGRSLLQISPWVILAPGFAIFITVMVFNLLGDTVRDLLDPRRGKKEVES